MDERYFTRVEFMVSFGQIPGRKVLRCIALVAKLIEPSPEVTPYTLVVCRDSNWIAELINLSKEADTK